MGLYVGLDFVGSFTASQPTFWSTFPFICDCLLYSQNSRGVGSVKAIPYLWNRALSMHHSRHLFLC